MEGFVYITGTDLAADYYSILGVPKDATTQEIKRAFRQIARECHPDVSGEDPDSEQRFKIARKAYETLMDPVTRARYDRRGKRRKHGGGSFFEAFYERTAEEEQKRGRSKTGPSYAPHVSGGSGATRRRRHDPGNDLSLDDLFRDFGDFGFGNKARGEKPKGTKVQDGPDETRPRKGADVQIELDVPADVARAGGALTAVYYRMQRADSWRPGSSDPGVVRVQDIADVRIIPGTRDKEVVRERGLGDAGIHGGPFGDLVIRLRLVLVRKKQDPPPPKEEKEPSTSSAPTPTKDEEFSLDIGVVEAILGGRVELETPQGRIKLSIPPGTSSDSRMRLKQKGIDKKDLYVRIRIVVPKDLDNESRRLIEEFARLNPGNPRS
jgi:DnaJ-class molecular chaperone